MAWVVFIYSLPGGQSSGPRVSIWRRLQRLGAVSPRGGVHVLPAIDDCVEALHWLAQEVQQSDGEPLIMRVDEFEGLSDQELTDLFRKQSEAQYDELEAEIKEIESRYRKRLAAEEKLRAKSEIQRLRKKHSEIRRTDFFDTAAGLRVNAQLAQLEKGLEKEAEDSPQIQKVRVQDFQGKIWVTRPRPHVDRLACIWLIRRFIDGSATILFAQSIADGEIGFDFKRGGTFGHVGNLCTFEVITNAFGLADPGLKTIAEIVHEIDIRDGIYWHPELSGIDSVLKGWLQTDMSDSELEEHGCALFEGLYQAVTAKAKVSKRGRLKGHE